MFYQFSAKFEKVNTNSQLTQSAIESLPESPCSVIKGYYYMEDFMDEAII